MVDDDEFAWIEEQATGDFDHLLLASSLPFALAPAIHHLEEWNEAVTAGAWGRPMAWVGRRSARGSTWSTGPRSTTPSTGWRR